MLRKDIKEIGNTANKRVSGYKAMKNLYFGIRNRYRSDPLAHTEH